MPNFRTPRIIGRILKSLFALLIIFVNGLLIWRIFFSTAMPDTIKTMLVNENTRAAYEQHGNDMICRYQNQSTITRAEYNYGYFSVTQCIFIPEANQVQIVVRYNNSTLTHLAGDYGLSEVPSKDLTLFDVTLVKTTDLTPENQDDNLDAAKLAKTRYYPSEGSVRDTTQFYTYYRYVFDGVTLDDLTVGVFADIYYVEDIDYEDRAYGTLCLYDYKSKWIEYKLTKADKKALSAAGA